LAAYDREAQLVLQSLSAPPISKPQDSCEPLRAGVLVKDVFPHVVRFLNVQAEPGVMSLFGLGPAGPAADANSPELCPDKALHIARMLSQGRRFKDALSLLDRAVARYPAHIELLHMRGLCLQGNNNVPEVGWGLMMGCCAGMGHVEAGQKYLDGCV
jgi:hypothetical protein